MNILIIGYGKMGKEIEQLALNRNHNISKIIDSENDWINFNNKNIDVAIEFSTPQTVKENILKCFRHNIPVVTGTTGWNDSLAEVENECKKQHCTLLYGPNFSIGMNIMFQLNKYLFNFIKHFPEYSAEIEETHNVHKIDKPSGTSVTLANDIINNNPLYKNWSINENNAPQTLKIKVIREGDAKGNHKVICISENDKICIEHEAFSRKGFATGAIIAAEWIKNKKGLYKFEDFFVESY